MLYFKEEIPVGGGLIYIYKGVSVIQMQNEIEMLMISLGYKHLTAGIFEKGNRTMRILFGAFCKYFKFKVIVQPHNEDEVKVSVVKETTGMSGGLIGMNQVKNEYARLSQAFKTI